MAKPIEIFKVGRHTAMSGETLAFGTRELDQLVASYNPKVHEAPIVFGHPKHDDPAYGWIARLERRGDRLVAYPTQVRPAVAELVDAGAYKKISASLYRPNQKGNPTPGKWSLRHVGLLGAMPPAIKGLAPASFAGSAAEALTVEFSAAELGGRLRALGSRLAALFASLGLADNEEATAAAAELEQLAAEAEAEPTPAEAVDEQAEEVAEVIAEQVADAVTALPDDASEEAVREAAKEAAVEAVDELVQQLEEEAQYGEPRRRLRAAARRHHGSLARRERELVRREHTAFLEQLVDEGRPLPASRDDMLGLFEVLHEARASADFSEGRSPLEAFKALLRRLPKQVSYHEIAGASSFAENATDADVAQRAVAYQTEQAARGVRISTSAAVRHVKGRR